MGHIFDRHRIYSFLIGISNVDSVCVPMIIVEQLSKKLEMRSVELVI